MDALAEWRLHIYKLRVQLQFNYRTVNVCGYGKFNLSLLIFLQFFLLKNKEIKNQNIIIMETFKAFKT